MLLKILILFIFIFSSCAPKINTEDQNKQIQGTLYLMGNEPFTSYAIEDEKGKITVLQNE